MKRWILVIPFVVVGLALVQCSQEPTSKPKTIAIATLMSHPALDELQEGLVTQLAAEGLAESETVRYLKRNANGQVQLAANIANDLVLQEPDVIVAITTPMAQSAAKVARCPLVFAAVTDPVGAGLLEAMDTPAEAITGTSDAWPYQAQLALIREILPNCKTLGVLYNPGEAASQYGIRKIREYAPKFGFQVEEAGVSTTTEVHPVAASLAGRVDALFLSSDNTVIGGAAGAVKAAIDQKVPLFVGDSGTVEKGGIAAVSVGYRSLGVETGKLVARVLAGERNIPVFSATGVDVYLNRKAAELMGVTLPESVISRATKVHDAIAK